MSPCYDVDTYVDINVDIGMDAHVVMDKNQAGKRTVKTIQMTIDENLLAQVDDVVAEKGGNRSGFIRDALRLALRQLTVQQLEERHAQGYAEHPVIPGEFDVWEAEQLWGDA